MNEILKDKKKELEIFEKGYTKVSLLSESEVETLLDSLHNLRPDDDFTQKDIDADYITYFDTSVDTDEEYRQSTSRLVTETLSPRIKKHFIDYRVTAGSFFIKAPKLGDLAPHQHFPITTDLNKKTFVIWCPLVDVDELNGTLQVVEGSHKIVPSVFPYDYPTFFVDYMDTMEDYSMPMNLKAGEAIIFDDKLIHWSAINNSQKPRIVSACLCVPENTPLVFYYFDKNNQDYFEVLEIDDLFFLKNRLTGLPIDRPKGLKSLGFVKNEKIILSEEKFLELLKTGKEWKSTIDIQKEMPKSGLSIIKRLKMFFG